MEHSLVIIKPDGVRRKLVGKIIQRFENQTFSITQMKLATMTQAQAKEHYKHLANQPFFPQIIDYMTSGPVVYLVVSGESVIELIRKMIGPTDALIAPPGTIRGDFATNKSENVIHASDSIQAAEEEINRFFGNN